MRTDRHRIVAGVGIAVGLVVVLSSSVFWEHKQVPFKNAPKLISALEMFSRDRTEGGREVPPEVSVEELVRGGYLTTNDVVALAGMDVTLYCEADNRNPNMVLASAHAADGTYFYLMVDGSVQQVSRSRYEGLSESLSQQSHPAKGSQPLRTETNSTPPTAGSPR